MMAEWWQSKLQGMEESSHRGRRPAFYQEFSELRRFSGLKGKSSEPLVASVSEQAEKLARHFEAVLDVQRGVAANVLDAADLSGTLVVDWTPPSKEEVRAAAQRGSVTRRRARARQG